MATMHTERVESRAADVVLDRPVYRVHFWELRDGYVPNLDAWILTDVEDLFEATAWVADHEAGRSVEVFVEWPLHPGVVGSPPHGIARLSGHSPVSG